MTTIQLKDANDNFWPIYWETSQNFLGFFTAEPQATMHLSNPHPHIRDTRLTISNPRDDGSRAALSLAGPLDHATLAFGGPQTGGLGSAFGIGNQGTYPLILTPGSPSGSWSAHFHKLQTQTCDLTLEVKLLKAEIASLKAHLSIP